MSFANKITEDNIIFMRLLLIGIYDEITLASEGKIQQTNIKEG